MGHYGPTSTLKLTWKKRLLGSCEVTESLSRNLLPKVWGWPQAVMQSDGTTILKGFWCFWRPFLLLLSSHSNPSQVDTQTKGIQEELMPQSRLKTKVWAYSLRSFINWFPFIHPTWFLSTPEHLTCFISLNSPANRAVILVLEVTFLFLESSIFFSTFSLPEGSSKLFPF